MVSLDCEENVLHQADHKCMIISNNIKAPASLICWYGTSSEEVGAFDMFIGFGLFEKQKVGSYRAQIAI